MKKHCVSEPGTNSTVPLASLYRKEDAKPTESNAGCPLEFETLSFNRGGAAALDSEKSKQKSGVSMPR